MLGRKNYTQEELPRQGWVDQQLAAYKKLVKGYRQRDIGPEGYVRP